MTISSRPAYVWRERRGVALMLVLWIVIVLGAVATAVVSATRAQSDLADTVRSRTLARYAAESGLVEAKVRLEESLGAAKRPEEYASAFAGFQTELERVGEQPLGPARYQMAVLDLNARIDLNESGEGLLLGLFEELFEPSEASTLVAALLDWIDEDDEQRDGGAEAPDYIRAGSPYTPANRPLQRLEELRRVRGFSDSVVTVLAPFVTVLGGGRVNANTAPREVLAAIPQVGPDGAEAIIAARAGGAVLESKATVWQRLAELRRAGVSAQLGPVTTVPSRILLISRGWVEGHPLTHEIQAVYELLPATVGMGPRLRVRRWSERDL